jgi:hypothetical protein
MADARAASSFSNSMRSRRFELFESLAAPLPKPRRILDVGGTTAFWEQRGWAGTDRAQITTINIDAEEKQYANIEPRAGDATDLSEFADGSFDIAFSNSVIEHLFSIRAQAAMAREIQRIATAYWVQTPNYWFPVEPHFQLPGWQWLPEEARIAIIRHYRCGWRGPCADRQGAGELVREVRLLRRLELQALFPCGVVWPERLCGLIKSWVAIGGFPRMAAGGEL